MTLLREYHEAIKDVIKYSGTLERYAGDGVMAVFNDPVPVENPALQAVLMALEMRDAIAALTETWRRWGHDIGFGIGIAHKHIGIKLDKAREGVARLVAAGHLTVREKDARIYYIPRIRGDCIVKSIRGDKEYYRWRGTMIDRTVADIRLTPAERVALLGILSQTWRDYTFADSSRDIAKRVCVSQPIVARVMSKQKQGENELKTSEATYAQSTGTSEANSVNSGNSLSVRTREAHLRCAPLEKLF